MAAGPLAVAPGRIPSRISATRCSSAAGEPAQVGQVQAGRPRPATPGGGRRAGARTVSRPCPGVSGDRPQPREDAWPDDAGADDSWPGDSWPGDPAATDPRLSVAGPADPGRATPGRTAGRRHVFPAKPMRPGTRSKTAKPRRRVGFRKGAEVDEELWPAETFGGVSDEQFWDDLASDKPLTTTARTAQQDPGTRSRPLEARSATDPQAQAPGDDRKRDGLTATAGSATASPATASPATASGPPRRPGPRRGQAGCGLRRLSRPTDRAETRDRAHRDPARLRGDAARPEHDVARPGATQPVRVASGTSQPMTQASRAPRARRQSAGEPAAGSRARSPAKRARGGGRAAPTRIR